jgi:hypothetical protein
MWALIKNFLSLLWANPVVRATATVAMKDIVTAGANVVKAAAVAIPEAATMEGKGTDKLNFVVDKLKDEVVDLPKAMLTNVVTSVYRSLNEEGKV